MTWSDDFRAAVHRTAEVEGRPEIADDVLKTVVARYGSLNQMFEKEYAVYAGDIVDFPFELGHRKTMEELCIE